MLSSPNVNPRITTLPLAVYLYLWDFHFVPNWSSTFFSNAAPRPCEALPARVSTSPPHPTWGSIFRGSFFLKKMKGWGCLNIVKSRSYSLESHLKTLDSQKFFCIEMLRSQLFVGLSLQEVLVLKSVMCYNAVMELEEDMGKNCMFQG